MDRCYPFLSALLLVIIVFAIAGTVPASSSYAFAPTPQPTPSGGRVATAAELRRAKLEWTLSGHANTFDNGMGGNTTCARCKSPKNWDPTAPAAQDALNCAACKRIPGAPRPELAGGVPVAPADWKNIGCEVCHPPNGNSYSTTLAYWNNATQKYDPVHDSTELCAKCHEGQHGFQVIEEQAASPVHQGWACTACHGAHGAPAACTDCHNPKVGRGAAEHASHPQVNCTACHDAGGLSIERVSEAGARHAGTYIPVRFAHTLTAWPSHNLQTLVDCRRCHHPENTAQGIVATRVGCQECHTEGAVLFWCVNFPRNPDPNATPTPGK